MCVVFSDLISYSRLLALERIKCTFPEIIAKGKRETSGEMLCTTVEKDKYEVRL